MQKLPVESSVLQFNGDLATDQEFTYGEEVLVIVRARVCAPAYKELKSGLKLVHRAELIEARAASEDDREAFEELLESDSDTPRLPFPAHDDEPVISNDIEVPGPVDGPVAPVVNGGEVTLTLPRSQPVETPAAPRPRGSDSVLANFLTGGEDR